VFLKIGKVGDVGCNFGEVSDSSWMICPQTVGFDDDAFLLDPRKKVVGGAVERYVAEGAVAEEVAANADVDFVLIFNLGHWYSRKIWNSFLPVRSGVDSRIACLSLVEVHKTKDGSSLSIMQNNFFIAVMGLNFVGLV